MLSSEGELLTEIAAASGVGIGRSESATLSSPGIFKSVIAPTIGVSPLLGVNVTLCIQATAAPGLVAQEVSV